MSAVSNKRRSSVGTVPTATTAGELGYILAAAVNNYYQTKKVEADAASKSEHRIAAEVLGELAFVTQEFHRHVAATYEDFRIAGNGPVFGGPTPDLFDEDSQGIDEDGLPY